MREKISKSKVKGYILKSAKELFLDKGYTKTSIRDISKHSGITLGRIYVYFKKKEDIFYELIKPTIDIIHELYDSSTMSQEVLLQSITSKEAFKAELEQSVKILENNKPEFYLAFFKSDGFQKVDIREEMMKSYMQRYDVYMKMLREINGNNVFVFSELFLKTQLNLYINIYENILLKNMSDEEKNIYIDNVVDFIYYGNLGLLRKMKDIEIEMGESYGRFDKGK